MIPQTRFDENFYMQARKPLCDRWNKFDFVRNREKEKALGEIYADKIRRPYVFLHEDKKRGFIIDRALISETFQIIEPLPVEHSKFTVFDYYSLIMGASEIHCIESSFAAFIESINVKHVKLYAHRYARPNAVYDYRYEFTYRSDWTIY